MVQRGILVQVTASSVTGLHGRRLKNFSQHLLDHDLVHFVASDAHHYSLRKFDLILAYKWIEKNYSINHRMYFETNAIHALHGEKLQIMEPKVIGRKRQYFFFYNHPLNQI